MCMYSLCVSMCSLECFPTCSEHVLCIQLPKFVLPWQCTGSSPPGAVPSDSAAKATFCQWWQWWSRPETRDGSVSPSGSEFLPVGTTSPLEPLTTVEEEREKQMSDAHRGVQTVRAERKWWSCTVWPKSTAVQRTMKKGNGCRWNTDAKRVLNDDLKTNIPKNAEVLKIPHLCESEHGKTTEQRTKDAATNSASYICRGLWTHALFFISHAHGLKRK